MTKQLLIEAERTMLAIKDLMWTSAARRHRARFSREERIYKKALNRYERRYKKWAELQL
jgi:hypothetical protein